MNFNNKNRQIHNFIKKHKNIFIMGHVDLDLDAIASCLAFYEIASQSNRKPCIIIDDKRHEAGVKKILDSVKNNVKIVKSSDIIENITDSDLLVVVDVNKNNILQNNELIGYFKNIMVIDHHEKSENTIKSSLEIIDNKSSSASEMLTKYIYYYGIKISNDLATIILSGIVLDTNNFTVKTTDTTYFAAYYLSKIGADNRKVQLLLKQDIDEYILRQKVITDVEIIKKNIAFAVGSQKIKYKREELAKIADTLLEFNHIEMSFVIGKLSDNIIGISGRSVGKRSVGKILVKLGGGGDRHEAAAKIEGKTLKEVEQNLKNILG